MIRVQKQNEPEDFDELVRQPGQTFLANTPNPTSKEFEKHAYWRTISRQFRQSYSNLCAYSCQHIDVLTGNANVEHFKPKSLYPNEAYEWDNYRLVCGILNSRKGTREILDPFLVRDGWFYIQFPSLLIHPAPNLETEIKAQVQNTINVLRLNEDDVCVPARRRYIDAYCCGNVTFGHLEKEAPFVAKELKRQDIVEKIKEIWNCSLVSRSQPL